MGLPPTAGFIAKFYVFSQAVASGLIWLVIIAVINSVISAFYYLKVIKVVWMDKPAQAEPIKASPGPWIVLAISALGTIVAGLLPLWGMKLAELGARLILP
jgi:NADH-quinone oxidoreductase subunit N